MKLKKAEANTQVNPGWLWFEVPYYFCSKCKKGIYDARVHIMEEVAIQWITEPDEPGTWH